MPQGSSVPFRGAQGRPLYPACARIPTPPAPKVQRKASPPLLPLSSVAHQEGTHGLQTKFVSVNRKVNPPAGQRAALRRASKKPKEGSAEKLGAPWSCCCCVLSPATTFPTPLPRLKSDPEETVVKSHRPSTCNRNRKAGFLSSASC